MQTITTESGTKYKYDTENFRLMRLGIRPLHVVTVDKPQVIDDTWRAILAISPIRLDQPIQATFTNGDWVHSTRVVKIEEE